METDLDELKRACRSSEKPSDAERIDQGESIWFAGRPAPADEGSVAISQDDDIRTIIRERDVQEVRKEGDVSLVRVRADADVLVRFERVTKARPEECECEGAKANNDDASGATARASAGFVGDPFGPFGTPIGHCRLFVRCIHYGGRRICWWWITCPGRVGQV